MKTENSFHQKDKNLEANALEDKKPADKELEDRPDRRNDVFFESGFKSINIETCELILPHPALASRIFVVVPLLEIAPNITIADGQPLRDLLGTDSLRAQPIKRVHSDELLI